MTVQVSISDSTHVSGVDCVQNHEREQLTLFLYSRMGGHLFHFPLWETEGTKVDGGCIIMFFRMLKVTLHLIASWMSGDRRRRT